MSHDGKSKLYAEVAASSRIELISDGKKFATIGITDAHRKDKFRKSSAHKRDVSFSLEAGNHTMAEVAFFCETVLDIIADVEQEDEEAEETDDAPPAPAVCPEMAEIERDVLAFVKKWSLL